MKYKGIKFTKEMLTDPWLVALLEKDDAGVRIAKECLTKINECVCPIYTPIRGGPNRAPTYIGCGVVAEVDQTLYLLTAAHVVEPNIGNLLIAAKTAVFDLPSLCYFTSSMLAKESGREPIDDDVLIIPLTGNIPDEIRSVALTKDHFDLGSTPNDGTTHGVLGFLASESSVDGLTLTGPQRAMITFEHSNEIYRKVGLNRTQKVVLSYVPYRLRNGNIEKTPTPRGMSGGAIFRIIGFPGAVGAKPTGPLTPRLTGIFQEQQNERGERPAMSIGARLSVYLDLIAEHVRKARREARSASTISMTVRIGGITPYSRRQRQT